ncbi:MAG: putative quinol monooxygenase, partial [Dermatophilaceae bacterium]
MSINVVATIIANPGSEDAVRRAMQGIVAPTRAEEGNVSYDLFEAADAPGTFITVEQWDAAADLETHLQTDHIQSALATLGTELAA